MRVTGDGADCSPKIAAPIPFLIDHVWRDEGVASQSVHCSC